MIKLTIDEIDDVRTALRLAAKDALHRWHEVTNRRGRAEIDRYIGRLFKLLCKFQDNADKITETECRVPRSMMLPRR